MPTKFCRLRLFIAGLSIVILTCGTSSAAQASRDSQSGGDRKSTRLNSSHLVISYAVFCLKKKTYHLIEVYPFIHEPPSGYLQERVLLRHHHYDQCFQSVPLLQLNSPVTFHFTFYLILPPT